MNLVNFNRIPTTNFLASYTAGKFRSVVKCRAGFMTVCDARDFENQRYFKYPEALIADFKKGALQTIQFQPEGTDHWLTIFARKGNKIVLVDEVILAHLTVGTINQLFYNTNLYSQSQYASVKAKTWADKAYVLNENNLEKVA